MWKELVDALLDLVYPPRRACPLCGGGGPGEPLCPNCARLLAGYAAAAVCPVCGSFGTPGGPRGTRPGSHCVHCRDGTRPFDLARSVGPYEGPLRQAVHRFKYHGVKALARPLGALMAEAAGREPAFARTQALVPVPMSPRRERQRGFNQALLLARELEAWFGVPVLERAVVKVRETPPQAELPRRERLHNLSGAFVVAGAGAVEGKIITVVDDVFTTGATASTISQILRQAGARQVFVLTLAGTRKNEKN